jgi:hypothetical protein
MIANFSNVRDLSSKPAMATASTAGVQATRTTVAETPESARAVVSVPIPVLKSLNSIGMMTTQMVFYRRSENYERRLNWSAFPFEALDRRGEIAASGAFGYENAYLRQVEFQPTQRLQDSPDLGVGGWVDEQLRPLEDVTHNALAHNATMVEAPRPPRPDERQFIPDAQILAGPEQGETIAHAQLKAFNHVLSTHRYFGGRGSALKDEWKAGEVERLERLEMVSRLASHGHLYVRMFAKLIASYYTAMYLEKFSTDGGFGNDRETLDARTRAGANFVMPRLQLLDANVPRFRELGVRVWSVAVQVNAQPPNIAYRYAAGVYVHRGAPNTMLHYASLANCIADFGVWAAPAANIAGAEVSARVVELTMWAKGGRFGTTEHLPHELLGAAIGGEVQLFDDVLSVHQGDALLLDVETVPLDVIELWVLVNCSRNYRVASNDGLDNRWSPHIASLHWECDYADVYLHSGTQRADTLLAVDAARLTQLRDNAHSIASGRWLSAIRWLLMKTGADQDFVEADEIISVRCCQFNSNAIGTPARRDQTVVFDGLMSGQEMLLPRDYTLPAYFYPFRERSTLRVESEEWLTLRPQMRVNTHYYMAQMLGASVYWANFAASMQVECWNDHIAGAASAQELAARKHGVELLTRRSAYALSLHDKLVANACAHMYGWSPSKHTLMSINSWRIGARSCQDWTPTRLTGYYQTHTVPHVGNVYHEMWLVKYLPDFLVLPCPEGTIKWPVDKPKPVIDSAADTSQVRLGAALPALDYKYWLADGGQVMSAQYYLATNATSDSTDATTFKHGGGANVVRLGAWQKPVQHVWPTAPGVVDPGAFFLRSATFCDYAAPAAFRMFNHHAKLPMAWGVLRTNAAGARVPGPVRSWYDLNQGKVGVAPTLAYEPPAWGVRDVEPVSDYYITALVDSEDGRFVGFHWAEVAKFQTRPGEAPSRSISLLPSQPMVQPAALANDNSPHEPAAWRGSTKGIDSVSRSINQGRKMQQKSNIANMLRSAANGQLSTKNRFSALEIEEVDRERMITPEPILVQQTGEAYREGGVTKMQARVVQKGGNATARSSLPQAKRGVRGRIVSGGGGAVARTEEVPTNTALETLANTVHNTVSAPVMTTRQVLKAASAGMHRGAHAGVQELVKRMSAMRRAKTNTLTAQAAKVAADIVTDLVVNGRATHEDVGPVLSTFPEVASVLESRDNWRTLAKIDGMNEQERSSIMFGDVQVQLIGGETDDSSGEEHEVTDAAAYQAQSRVADTAAWAPKEVDAGLATSASDAIKADETAHLDMLNSGN